MPEPPYEERPKVVIVGVIILMCLLLGLIVPFIVLLWRTVL